MVNDNIIEIVTALDRGNKVRLSNGAVIYKDKHGNILSNEGVHYDTYVYRHCHSDNYTILAES